MQGRDLQPNAQSKRIAEVNTNSKLLYKNKTGTAMGYFIAGYMSGAFKNKKL